MLGALIQGFKVGKRVKNVCYFIVNCRHDCFYQVVGMYNM